MTKATMTEMDERERDADPDPLGLRKLEEVFLEPLRKLACAWYGTLTFRVERMEYSVPADWYCQECGKPQLGACPKISGYDVYRCVACGPGEGFAKCPATHGGERCVLCGGSGWVEELV